MEIATVSPNSIVIDAALWQKFLAHLLRASAENPHPPEELAYMFASLNASSAGLRLVVRDMLVATPNDYQKQSSSSLELKPSFVARVLSRCQQEGWSLIDGHSHQEDTSAVTTFSQTDWEYDLEAMPLHAALLGAGARVASVVVGQQSVDAHFYEPDTVRILPLRHITLVGPHQGRMLSFLPTTSCREEDTISLSPRYHRQTLFFGSEVQRLLARLTIAIVGLGGLGFFVAMELAHLGVGHLLLIDADSVEETNLNRLPGAGHTDIGFAKVAVCAAQIAKINPAVRVSTLPASLCSNEGIDLAKGADILIGCVDTDAARLILNELAVRYLIPLIDGGSGIALPESAHPQLVIGGQVQVVLPGTRCLLCAKTISVEQAARDLKSPAEQALDRAHGYNSGEISPSVISLNGVIASLQVTVLLQLLSGDLTASTAPRLLLYDAVEGKVTPVPLRSSVADCPVCGTDGLSGFGDLAPIRFAYSSSSLSVAALKRAE